MGKQRNFIKGRYTSLPHSVLESKCYINLSPNAIRLLIELAFQFKGYNNGKLCAIPDQLVSRGFKSATTVYKATKELLDAELILCTKFSLKGSRKPNYYAVTWLPINEINGFKMDIPPTNKPPRNFAVENHFKQVA